MITLDRTAKLAATTVSAIATLGGAACAQAAVVSVPVTNPSSATFASGDNISFSTGAGNFLGSSYGYLDASATAGVQISGLVAAGTTIDGSRSFQSSQTINGLFKPSVTGDSLYLPFELQTGTGHEFGFLTLDITQNADLTYTTIVEADTLETSGNAITAGALSAVPEPSSLAMLAAGALGLAAYRRRQRA